MGFGEARRRWRFEGEQSGNSAFARRKSQTYRAACRLVRAAAVSLFAVLVAGCSGGIFTNDTITPTSTAPGGGPAISLVPILDGLSAPIFFLEEQRSGTFLIAEQGGRILAAPRDGSARPQVLLDISSSMSTGTEQGLLGLAIHPDFASGDPRFYIDYTDLAGDTQIDEYRIIGKLGEPTAVPLKTRTILSIYQPHANHNGGMLAFGPDGMLYIGMGDGGSGGDPEGNGQDRGTLLGKILRIDVGPPEDARPGVSYHVPADNPYADGGGRGEIWDYGLRNPWRFSFDSASGDLWIGDVGQTNWEEIDLEAGGRGGNNYGWSAFEGSHLFDPLGGAVGAIGPVAEYDHSGNRCSVTGGYMYRGAQNPALVGTYLYADYCAGTIWGLVKIADGWTPTTLLESGFRISSFGEDANGELYVVDHGGGIYRIAAPVPRL